MKKHLLTAAFVLLGLVAGQAQQLARSSVQPTKASTQQSEATQVTPQSPRSMAKSVAALPAMAGKSVAAAKGHGPLKAYADGVYYNRPAGVFYTDGSVDGTSTSWMILPVFHQVQFTTPASNPTWLMNGEAEEANEDGSLNFWLPKGKSSNSLFYPLTLESEGTQFELTPYLQNTDSVLEFLAPYNYTKIKRYYGFGNGHSAFESGPDEFDFDGDGVAEPIYCRGFYQYVEKPATPLNLYDIYMWTWSTSGIAVPEDVELHAHIVRAIEDEEGSISFGDTIATLVCTSDLADISEEKNATINGYVGDLTFANFVEDEFGSVVAEPILISDAFFVVFDGLAQEGVDVHFYFGDSADDEIEFNNGQQPTFILFNDANGDPIDGALRYYGKGNNNYCYNVTFWLEGEQDGLMINGDGIQTAPAEGGDSGDEENEPVYLFTNFPMFEGEEWAENYDFEGIPEWAQLKIDPSYYENAEYPNVRGLHMVWFECEPLPAGMSGRQAVITVTSARGAVCDGQITLIQGVISDVPSVGSIAEFLNAGTEDEVQLTLTNALVTYAKESDVYVQDATGAIEFFNTGLPLEAGKAVNGTVLGKLSIYNDLPEFVKTDNTNADNLTFSDSVVVAADMTVADALKTENLSKLINLKSVNIVEDGGKYYAVSGEDRVQIYDKFKVIGSDYTYPERANITGITCIFKGTMQIMPIEEPAALAPLADFAEGKYYLVNIVSGKTWGAGNSWGTQASLVEHPEYVILHPQADGTFTMETQVNNGGTQYFFNGDFMDNGSPVSLTISKVQELGENDLTGEPVYAYTIANGDNYYGWDGETTVLGKNLPADSDNALWVIASEEEAIAGLAAATEEDPMDATFLILDPNFGRNNRNQGAWEGDGFSKGGDNTNQNAEKWGGNSQEFDIHQTVSAPNGKYLVTWNGFYRYNNTTDNTNEIAIAAHADGTEVINSFVYINGQDYPLTSIADEAASAALDGALPFSQAEAGAAFAKGLYVQSAIVEVTDGKLTIGIKKTSHPGTDWTVWDNFSLLYYGETVVNPDDPELVAPDGWTSVITNGNLASDDVSCFFAKEYPASEPSAATIVAGAGKNNSRGIVVKSQDMVSQAWDSQFWIKVSEQLPEGTKLHVEFDYKADNAGSVGTQSHGAPGAYKHWGAIGSVEFASEWKHFSADVTVEGDMADMESIAFNLNDITAGNTFYFDNFGVWIQKPKPVDEWVDVIVNGNMEGTTVANFFSKEAPSAEVLPSVIFDGAGVDGSRGIKVTSIAGAANDWDSQFWIYLPFTLPEGTKYKVEFDYKADRDASADTQAHGEPGAYIHWAFIGSPSFTTAWQHFEKEGTISADQAEAKTDGVPNGNKCRSIAFNLSKDKENDVTFFFDNVKFSVEKSFYDTGIFTVSGNNGANAQNFRFYNLNGQQVQQPTRGLYIQNGRKVVVK